MRDLQLVLLELFLCLCSQGFRNLLIIRLLFLLRDQLLNLGDLLIEPSDFLTHVNEPGNLKVDDMAVNLLFEAAFWLSGCQGNFTGSCQEFEQIKVIGNQRGVILTGWRYENIWFQFFAKAD